MQFKFQFRQESLKRNYFPLSTKMEINHFVEVQQPTIVRIESTIKQTHVSCSWTDRHTYVSTTGQDGQFIYLNDLCLFSQRIRTDRSFLSVLFV